MAAKNFFGGLSDRTESGDIAVIIGVEYDAVSGFFYFETRVSDPCDFHSFSPFLKQVLSKRRVHRKHCNAILGVLQPLWCHLKEFRSHYFAFSKSSSRRALQKGAGHGAGLVVGDLAAAVEDYGVRKDGRVRAAQGVDAVVVGVDRAGEADSFLSKEFRHVLERVGGVNDEHDYIVGMGFLETFEFRKFLDAGAAVGCPHVEDDDFAAVVGQGNWVPSSFSAVKSASWLPIAVPIGAELA